MRVTSDGLVTYPRPRRRFVKALAWIVAVLLLLTVVFLAWANTTMRGDREAAMLAWDNPNIKISSTDSAITIAPADVADNVHSSTAGLVFIPGARVDPYAYLNKLSGVVEETGTTVVITKPTLNLAFFDTRDLESFTKQAPNVDSWYVGGHSLGGVRACQLADSQVADGPPIVGLVLFGSYCANDLSDTNLRVLSISGGNDGLSTPEKITAAKHLLPASTVETPLRDLNHADFGDYGAQPGDGISASTSAEAKEQITEQLVEFFAN